MPSSCIQETLFVCISVERLERRARSRASAARRARSESLSYDEENYLGPMDKTCTHCGAVFFRGMLLMTRMRSLFVHRRGEDSLRSYQRVLQLRQRRHRGQVRRLSSRALRSPHGQLSRSAQLPLEHSIVQLGACNGIDGRSTRHSTRTRAVLL